MSTDGYELADILNRCVRDDMDFFLSTIASSLNFTDDKLLKSLNRVWSGEGGTLPEEFNHKVEEDIRYLGSNDVAYLKRKWLGRHPAGVSMNEIIDDLSEPIGLQTSNLLDLEDRLQIFAGQVIEQQFARLDGEQKRKMLEDMRLGEQETKKVSGVVLASGALLPAILPLLNGGRATELLQGLTIAMIAPFAEEPAKESLSRTLAGLSLPADWLDAGVERISAGKLSNMPFGPASQKTIPLVLYLAVLSFREEARQAFRDFRK